MFRKRYAARLALIAVCAVLAGCVGGREHETVESAVGPWKRWEVTPADEFGGAFTLIYINAIVPPTDTEPWTAVGYIVGSGGERKPTAWSSRDGVSWDAEELPASDSSTRWNRPFNAARNLGTIVAFGLRGESGDEGVVAWQRTEDTGWSWLPNHPLERVAVTAGPKGEIGIVASDDVQSDIYIGYP